MRVIGGHPRLIELTDALLRHGRASLHRVQDKLRDLARHHDIDLQADQPLTDRLDQALLLGSTDILLAELTVTLTPAQAAALTQIAVSRAPMTPGDLRQALTTAIESDPGDAAQIDVTTLDSDLRQLADLTLIDTSGGIVMHPWTAELITRQAAGAARILHERALAMRLHRAGEGRAAYADYTEIPRHLASLSRHDDAAAVTSQVAGMLPGTLATLAYLADIRPLIPPAERAWIVIADLEAQALLRYGDLEASRQQLHAIHHQIQARATADPANTQWQRDLSVSHDKIGDAAVAAGDLTAARASYQASLDIATRLTAADPANTTLAESGPGSSLPTRSGRRLKPRYRQYCHSS